jgi:hypothetical protein
MKNGRRINATGGFGFRIFPVFSLSLNNLFQMHLAGKTDKAKADLARLAKIRQDREEAQQKREAEAKGNPPL